MQLDKDFNLLNHSADDLKDEIIVDPKHEGTVFIIKHLEGTNLNVIIRLALSSDKHGLKNSVMTFFRIRDKNLKKLRKRGKVLYNSE